MASQSFSIRAAGADRAFLRQLVGKFPLEIPDFTGDPEGPPWEITSETTTTAEPPSHRHSSSAPRSTTSRTFKIERPGARTFGGVPESGLGGNYFVLVKQRGSDDLVALPVDEWYTFRPEPSRPTTTLEEAEAQMAAMRRAHERVRPRFAEISGDGGEDAPAVGGGADEDEADSDEEWKKIKAKAGARTATMVRRPAKRPSSARSGDDDEGEDEGPAVRGAADAADEENADKGEDWEHEEKADDDDLDMGGSEDEAAPVPSPTRRRGRAGRSDSDEEDEGERVGGVGGEADDVERRTRSTIARIMHQTGLGSDEEEESDLDDDGPGGRAGAVDGSGASAPAAAGEGSDDDSDGDDLDRMASVDDEGTQAPAAAPAEPPSGSRKRKPSLDPRRASPPPAAPSVVPVAKRSRGGSRSPSPAPGSRGASPAARLSASPAPSTPVSREEVVALLRRHGRMPLKEIAAAFKARVAGDAKGFSALVKQVARLDPTPSEDGTRYLVLRPGIQ